MKDPQEILDAIVDKVLADKPKWKTIQTKRYRKKKKHGKRGKHASNQNKQ